MILSILSRQAGSLRYVSQASSLPCLYKPIIMFLKQNSLRGFFVVAPPATGLGVNILHRFSGEAVAFGFRTFDRQIFKLKELLMNPLAFGGAVAEIEFVRAAFLKEEYF
jgi:hypothetical protein